ncbi:tetratricopeptide repeat protein, partial [Deinococcus sp. A31D244]|uniref:tetratricopeptide repeat protein n=1 Tax=Deinococcus sp. A31D244 TaxID=3397675 RepID=UPI0039DFF0AD
MAPFVFVIPVQDFDVELLPLAARVSGSPEFRQAVVERITREYEPFTDRVEVEIDDQTITVTAWPKEAGIDPVDVGIAQLQDGDLAGGAQTLEALVTAQPMNPAILFNLGMAKSDLNETADAIRYLARFLTVVPGHAGALTALGLAYFRSGDIGNSLEIMQKAVDADPANGYAVRNLGGVLASQGRQAEAAPHLIRAAELLPEDLRALYGAAQALQERGDDDSMTLADTYLKRIIDLDPRSDIAEEAR